MLLPLISVRIPLPLMEVFTVYKTEQMITSLTDEGLKQHLVISTEWYNMNRAHNRALRFSWNIIVLLFLEGNRCIQKLGKSTGKILIISRYCGTIWLKNSFPSHMAKFLWHLLNFTSGKQRKKDTKQNLKMLSSRLTITKTFVQNLMTNKEMRQLCLSPKGKALPCACYTLTEKTAHRLV